MKRFVGIVLLLSLTACVEDGPDSFKAKAARDNAIISDSVCTEQQMQRVQSETQFCNKNTSYFSEFCYRSAIQRVCSRGPAQ